MSRIQWLMRELYEKDQELLCWCRHIVRRAQRRSRPISDSTLVVVMLLLLLLLGVVDDGQSCSMMMIHWRCSPGSTGCHPSSVLAGLRSQLLAGETSGVSAAAAAAAGDARDKVNV